MVRLISTHVFGSWRQESVEIAYRCSVYGVGVLDIPGLDVGSGCESVWVVSCSLRPLVSSFSPEELGMPRFDPLGSISRLSWILAMGILAAAQGSAQGRGEHDSVGIGGPGNWRSGGHPSSWVGSHGPAYANDSETTHRGRPSSIGVTIRTNLVGVRVARERVAP